MPEYGMGTCACGQPAIVGLNGRPCCLACLDTRLVDIRDRIATALRGEEASNA